jgi:hypothetical protein
MAERSKHPNIGKVRLHHILVAAIAAPGCPESLTVAWPNARPYFTPANLSHCSLNVAARVVTHSGSLSGGCVGIRNHFSSTALSKPRLRCVRTEGSKRQVHLFEPETIADF